MKLDPEEKELLEAYVSGKMNPQKPSNELLSREGEKGSGFSY